MEGENMFYTNMSLILDKLKNDNEEVECECSKCSMRERLFKYSINIISGIEAQGNSINYNVGLNKSINHVNKVYSDDEGIIEMRYNVYCNKCDKQLYSFKREVSLKDFIKKEWMHTIDYLMSKKERFEYESGGILSQYIIDVKNQIEDMTESVGGLANY